MNEALQIKLQAYFDGELSGREAREISELIAKDAEARALLAELKNIGGTLREFEPGIKLPETREFYWSKIEREIQRLERSKPADAPASIFAAWRRLLVPVGAIAVLILAGILISAQFGASHKSNIPTPAVEALLADSGAVTYRDQETGTTLVWLSYQAENDFSDSDVDDIL